MAQYYGKVLVINGVSSSGKTTLSQKLFKYGFHHISQDNVVKSLLYYEIATAMPSIINLKSLTKSDIVDIVYQYPQFKNYTQEQLDEIATIKQNLSHSIDEYLNNIYISDQEIIEQISEETKKYIARGENVVIDTVMTTPQDMNEFFTFFHYHKKIILLYTPLEQNLANCFTRPLDDLRYPTKVISQFMEIYQFDSNGSQGMTIAQEKISNVFEYVRSNLKEIFHFFPEPKLLKVQKNTEDSINKAQSALINANKVFISSHMLYDIAITVPQGEITDQLLIFLMNFVHQTDNSLELLDILPNFIAFQ